MDKIRIGIVGAAGRGGSFFSAFTSNPRVTLQALCDLNEERIREVAGTLGVPDVYTDYEEMLDKGRLDAVVVGTPMHLHAGQSIMALERDISVMSEVTAAVSIEEARDLVRACNGSRATYMMAENCCYMKPMVLVREIAKAGLFGKMYYAEGEYLHELKALNEITKWRRQWHTGIDGNTYCTHNLGPIYQWMGERVTSVSCTGTGHHYIDPRGDRYENEDTTVTLCRTESGALIELRLDMLSPRPYSIFMRLQGTEGCYEAPRSAGEQPRICLESRGGAEEWIPLSDLESEFLPAEWHDLPREAIESAHDGSDYMVASDFVDAVVTGRPPSIGIHEAMDMTLPGLVSQQSIAQNSAWLPVPNSREW